MQKIQGFTEAGNTTLTITGAAGTITRKVQGSFPSSTVTVYLANTVTLATIYADSSSTPKANPFTSSADGTWFFYAANGKFDVNFSGGGIAAPFTIGGLGSQDISNLLGAAYITAADAQGLDAGAKISAAIAQLSSIGGTIDCRGLIGAQSISVTVVVDRPVHLIFGNITLSSGANPAFNVTASGALEITGTLGNTTMRMVGGTGTFINAQTRNPIRCYGVMFTSGSVQSAGSAMTIDGDGANDNQFSQITGNIFRFQWVAINMKSASVWYVGENEIDGIQSVGIQIENTLSADSGDQNIECNVFSCTAHQGDAILYKAGGGLIVQGNHMILCNRGLNMTWNSNTSSSQLLIVGNEFDNSFTEGVRISRAAGKTGVFSSVVLAGNYFAQQAAFPGIPMHFAVDTSLWNYFISITGNIVDLNDAPVYAIQGDGYTGDFATIENNVVHGVGTSGAIKYGSNYTNINIGLNNLSTGSGLSYNISSGLRGSYLPDKLWVGAIDSGLVLTQQVLIPNNTFYSARNQAGTLQNALLGLDTSNNVVIGQDQNATALIAGPLRVAVGLDAHAAQINNIKVYTPSLTPVSVAAGVVAEQVFTVTGITANDTVVVIGPPPNTAVGMCGWRVGTNQLAISWVNPTAGPLTPIAGVYKVLAFTAFAV